MHRISHVNRWGVGMRVAVIGTGIAGNAAAWTVSKRYPVTVYDREIIAGRVRQVAHSGARPRRPPARRDRQRPPPQPDYGGAVALVLRAAARHPENRRGDPLGSTAAVAQGSTPGPTPVCRRCEVTAQYRLGDRRTQRLYWNGVAYPRKSALVQ